MAAAKRSRTAQGVAAERAVLTDMGVLDDPFAREMLAPTMTAVVVATRFLPDRAVTGSITMAGLAARVLWFDAQITAALDAGIKQIAVVGAGYDSRSWRFRRDGVRFFELDHGASQQDKIVRAPGHGPTYVQTDLTQASAAPALLAHGLDPSCPALLIVEGVTMYLAEDTVRHQLRDLAECSAPGSRLVADFYPPPSSGTSRNRRQLLLQRVARAGSSEGFRLTVTREQASQLVRESGWDVTDVTGLRTAALALVPAGSGLAIDAINNGKTLIAAVRS